MLVTTFATQARGGLTPYSPEELLEPPNLPLLSAAASLAALVLSLPLALAGGAHAVRMQSALLSRLMLDGGELR